MNVNTNNYVIDVTNFKDMSSGANAWIGVVQQINQSSILNSGLTSGNFGDTIGFRVAQGNVDDKIIYNVYDTSARTQKVFNDYLSVDLKNIIAVKFDIQNGICNTYITDINNIVYQEGTQNIVLDQTNYYITSFDNSTESSNYSCDVTITETTRTD